MADGDFLDPRGDTPVGSTYPMGNLGSNDPLVDWASNLQKDDLAKFLHDPQGQAQEWAARGHPPPTPEQMQSIHDRNDQANTPSRSTRMDAQTDQGPLAGPYRVDPKTGRLLNLTDPRNAQPPAPPAGGGKRPIQMFGGTEAGDVDNPWDKGMGQPAPPPDPNSPVARFNRWRNPNDPNNLPAPPPSSPAGAAGAPAVAAPPAAAPAPPVAPPVPPLAAPAPPAAAPEGAKGKGQPKNPQEEQGDKLEQVGKTIGELGKAMQGVKAPEPLRPPNIGAPNVHAPLAAGASPVAALAGLLSGHQTGQVPPSVMPILRMLGRG